MRKIKKFKINLRKREVLRNLKLLSQVKEITRQIEEMVDSEIKRSDEYITPASVYSSFNEDEIMIKFGASFFSEEGQKKPITATFIIVSIGEQIENEIKKHRDSGEIIRSDVIRSIGIEATESALNFVHKLIEDEARREDAEVLAPEKLDISKSIQIVNSLDSKKIGVYINEKNQIQPEFSSVAVIKWK
ncbi:MAG: hypothetical protein AB1633_01420 [Elusimicrobiota bacterium]